MDLPCVPVMYLWVAFLWVTRNQRSKCITVNHILLLGILCDSQQLQYITKKYVDIQIVLLYTCKHHSDLVKNSISRVAI